MVTGDDCGHEKRERVRSTKRILQILVADFAVSFQMGAVFRDVARVVDKGWSTYKIGVLHLRLRYGRFRSYVLIVLMA